MPFKNKDVPAFFLLLAKKICTLDIQKLFSFLFVLLYILVIEMERVR